MSRNARRIVEYGEHPPASWRTRLAVPPVGVKKPLTYVRGFDKRVLLHHAISLLRLEW